MIDKIEFICNFIIFSCKYGITKCVTTMLFGIMVLPVIWLIRVCNHGRSANVNFYSMLLVLPMAFTGMSKLFYQRYMWRITILLFWLAKSDVGCIYFAVALLILTHFIYKNIKLKRWIAGLEPFSGTALMQRAMKKVLGDTNSFFRKKYVERVRVYVTTQEISPFSGGIFRPYIVIPSALFQESADDEQLMMLTHEYMHIKSGHIIWLTLFRLLWIYWWINPIMFLLNRRLYEAMEMACDEKCIWYTNAEPYAYGSVLLAVAKNIQPKTLRGAASLVSGNDYRRIKKRIFYIEKSVDKKSFFRKQKHQTIAFTLLFAGIILGIHLSSYPKFTIMKETYIYDEDLKLRVKDYNELKKAITVKNGELIINHEEFARLLEEYDIAGDYVYVSFDSVMKMPGYGGGGNVGMVSTSDYDDIFYLSAETLENKLMVFVLKYIL
ncbi:MAG: M56 family metallopeptidase [Clostridium sp.]|nr:M56 family metallopeptidase [Clostridium sp.]